MTRGGPLRHLPQPEPDPQAAGPADGSRPHGSSSGSLPQPEPGSLQAAGLTAIAGGSSRPHGSSSLTQPGPATAGRNRPLGSSSSSLTQPGPANAGCCSRPLSGLLRQPEQAAALSHQPEWRPSAADQPLSHPQPGSPRSSHPAPPTAAASSVVTPPSFPRDTSYPARDQTSSYYHGDTSAAAEVEVEAGCHSAALLAAAGIIRWLVDHDNPAPGSSSSGGVGGGVSSREGGSRDQSLLDDDGQAQVAVSGVLAWLRDRGNQPPHTSPPLLHLHESRHYNSQPFPFENTREDRADGLGGSSSSSSSGDSCAPKSRGIEDDGDDEEEEEEDEDRCCSVCMERRRGVLLAPCGHAPVCVSCCDGIRQSSNKVRTWHCYHNLSACAMHPMPQPCTPRIARPMHPVPQRSSCTLPCATERCMEHRALSPIHQRLPKKKVHHLRLSPMQLTPHAPHAPPHAPFCSAPCAANRSTA